MIWLVVAFAAGFGAAMLTAHLRGLNANPWMKP